MLARKREKAGESILSSCATPSSEDMSFFFLIRYRTQADQQEWYHYNELAIIDVTECDGMISVIDDGRLSEIP